MMKVKCKTRKLQGIIKHSAAVLFWAAIWLIAAKSIDTELLLPAPDAVIIRLFELLAEKELYVILFTSLLRVLFGITSGILLGILFAVLTSLVKPFEILLSPLFSIIKATPVASFIMLALLWIDSSLLPSFITFLIVFPLSWANISEGIKSAPKGLLEITSVYKMTFYEKIIHVYVPHLIPFFVSTAKSALGLAWKAGIAAEVLAVPKNAIGSKIYSSKVFLETTDLFVWTLLTVLLSVLLEACANLLLSRLCRAYSYSESEVIDGN